MEATSNSPILAVVIFIGSTGGNKSQKSGGHEVFIKGGRLGKTVASIEAGLSGGKVCSRGGHSFCRIELINGWGEMRSYEIVSLHNPRWCLTLSVAVEVAELKKGSCAQYCEGNKMNRDDKG